MYLAILVLMFSFITVKAEGESCNTPNNETGECVLLKSCPILLQTTTDKSEPSMEFLRKSLCGFDGADPKVCCTLQSRPFKSTENKQKKDNKHLLANRSYCGYQHSDEYAHDTNGTLITEFPWLARLVYRRVSENLENYEKRYLCLGSLINNRYILTAAQCVTNKLYVVMQVQLGEYHTANDTDCVVETGFEECSDPVLTFGIDKLISHSEFDTKLRLHDIGLIRLNHTVSYSDYIRPICLPYAGTKFAQPGDILTISGWGFINSQGDEAVVKKRVLSNLITNDDCGNEFRQYGVDIKESHLCTRSPENSTALSCRGDAGAPVVFSHRLQWHQEGIVSFGAGRCGDMLPDVQTRVQFYLDWIEENIEP